MNLKAFDNKHAGNRGFVIGGGPSLHKLKEDGFDFLSLQVSYTVGANKCYRLLVPNYLVFCDWRFCVLYGKELEEVNCIKFTKESYIDRIRLTIPDLYGIPADGNRMGQGFISHSFTDKMTFPNAGGSALIVAYMLGLNPIYLLGIDVKSYEDKTHFHDEYDAKDIEWRISTGLYMRMMLVFEPILKQLKKRNIEVYSCSPISELNNIIPYVDINSLM